MQAHHAVHDEEVADDVRRVLLERAAAARVEQAVRTLMERAEQVGRAEEAGQWTLHGAARSYTVEGPGQPAVADAASPGAGP